MWDLERLDSKLKARIRNRQIIWIGERCRIDLDQERNEETFMKQRRNHTWSMRHGWWEGSDEAEKESIDLRFGSRMKFPAVSFRSECISGGGGDGDGEFPAPWVSDDGNVWERERERERESESESNEERESESELNEENNKN